MMDDWLNGSTGRLLCSRAMRLVKSVVVGLLVAVTASALAITLQMQLSLGAVTSRGPEITSGDDNVGVSFGAQVEAVSINLMPSMIVGLAAGVGGFAWQWKRGRRSLRNAA